MHPDYDVLAGLWLVAVVVLFAVLIYRETWRTGKQLRRHRALLAGVGDRASIGPTVAAYTWQLRRDLAMAEVRERRRLRRLMRVSAVMTVLTILGLSFVLSATPIDPATLVVFGR